MEFIAWLRKIQHALHECAESIRRTEQCKWNQEMMRADPSKPLDIRAVVSYDQQTVTDAATQDERNHTTQESIKNATWAAFYAVAAYAVITTFMWCAMMEQNKLARESIHQNERQWKAQQRPWVGLSGNVEFPKPPMLEVFAANGPNYTQIDLSVMFKMKNFGISPAFKAASQVQVEMRDNTLTLSQNQMKRACSLADHTSQGEGTASFGNSAIFPTGEITSSFDTMNSQPIELAKIRRVWIAECTAYQDQASDTIHHTKLWIVSFMVPENAVPAVIERNAIVTKFTLPIKGWEIVKTEAD